ncbi:TonB-dependent receptor [Nitrosococcus halophilus]|uniref:TonB-dependent receptor n=1 Tax=Nitrosococcus halophilus TaxID=133539 RepID=UPI000674E2AA|nr:TonB-dependent receptor [Nitrosococcus halophilus]
MAKELDPNDPTPWFYDAIRKQTANRPVEALHDMQKAIELNDNRAVYRSKLLLDEDLAARSATIGRMYNELGFESRGLVEGWKSIYTDPANYSAHRLLADSYFFSPRRGIARVSELLQSQLLQPINITPVQPQLAESDLFLLGGLGPAAPSLNEFNPLFLRDRFALLASGIVGGNGTWGDEVVQSGLLEKLSYSLGQYHFETDGFRPNNDFQQDIYNLFIQGALSPNSSVQAELRSTEVEEGERRLNFFLDNFDPNFHQNRKTETARLGFHHGFSPRSDLLAFFIYKKVEGGFQTTHPSINFSGELKEEAYLIEGQHLVRWAGLNLVSGAGHFDTLGRQEKIVADFFIPFPRSTLDETEANIQHTNVYLYSYFNYGESLTLILGASGNFFKGTLVERNQFNPKIGLMWRPSSETILRAAAFRVLEPGLSIGQTIEPI